MDSYEQLWPSEDARSIEVVVHTINMGDVEDPDLMVAAPIYEWQQTEAGKYIMEHSRPTPSWHRFANPMTYGYEYKIKAYLSPKQLTFYKLKFQ